MVSIRNVEHIGVTLTGSGTGAAIDTERQIVATGLTVHMSSAGIQRPVRREAPVRPHFATILLTMQGNVPAPAQAIGACGAGNAIGGAVLTLVASVAVAILLLIGVAVVVLVLFLNQLFD